MIVNAEAFWRQVDSSAGLRACWPWTGQIMVSGYGRVRASEGRDGRARAHRVALLLTVGEPPPGKPHALHSCDNPPCCNPSHLRWGSAQENRDDAARRGRASAPPVGAHHGYTHRAAKLTEETLAGVRAALAAGESQRRIAMRFGISQASVSQVNTGRTWARC